MKTKFSTKKKKKRKWKFLFIIITISIGLYLSYQSLSKSNIKLNDKEFLELVKDSAFTTNQNTIIDKLITKVIEVNNPVKLMSKEYTKHIKLESNEIPSETTSPPIIYLYNTHQTEEYAPSNYAEFSVNPTVIMNDYILEDIFNKNGYKTIVEESSIKTILKENNWNYVNSYKASRILLEQKALEYPSLKYFIDIHRDSLKKDKTTVEINGKTYAKVLFIIGLENPNYEKNLALTEKINNKLDELYPNLSKGIYKKGGDGVNGIYNQDFSPNTLLIEVGGIENTTGEVLNSVLAFSEVFMEIINE